MTAFFEVENIAARFQELIAVSGAGVPVPA
jgi:hypothetical protein